MKTKRLFLAFLIAMIAILMVGIPAGAGKNNPASMNAQFMHWQEKDNIIHIIVHDDVGRAHVGPAYIPKGKPLIFGFEWGCFATLAEGDAYVNDPGHDLTLTIGGDLVVPETSVKEFYQPAIWAETQTGPAWTWDHDGDGPFDRDGDGFGDWSGPMVFFRFPYPGLDPGTYTFTFTYYDGYSLILADTLTVIVP